MIIAIDFDGTIAKTRYPRVEQIFPYAIMYIHRWRRDGHKIILWTCREGESLKIALEASSKEGIVFDAVNESIPKKGYDANPRKIFFDHVIDDKFPMPVEDQWHALNEKLGGSSRKTINANVLKRTTRRKG